ncbi:MAG: hypothetical protein PHO41_09800, partial [Eubacteriales bacterium]|nr:hypothetical protein [Eubacteriales bacterium]
MKARKRIALMLALVLACLPLTAWGEATTQAEAVTLEEEEISSLAFLAENTSLQTLTLYNCPAVDLSPLASCKKLTTLTIAWDESYAGGTAYDLAPLAKCTRLHSLTLEGACVNDLTALADLQTLSTLSVAGLAAEDYTPIAELPLSHLLLSGAPAEQVAAIFSALGRRLNSAVLGDCALTPEASAAVLQSTHLTSLRFEGVSGLATDAAAWSRLTNLSALQMDGCTLDSLDFLSNYVSTVIIKLENCTVNGTVCGVAFDKYFLETNNLPADTLLALLQSDGCQWLYATIQAETETVSGAVITRLGEISSLLSVDVQNVSADAWADACWSGFA